VLGETCLEERREWIVMEISGEMVHSPLQVSPPDHMSLLQGGQYVFRTPRV
jgi:hypothetical protein